MKLTEERIIKICKLIDDGYSFRTLPVKAGISRGTANYIILRYRKHGINGLINRKNITYTPEIKKSIIERHYSGESICSLAIELNVRNSVVSQWIKKYEQMGYNGLIDNRGKPGVSKMGRPKKNKTQEQQVSTTEGMAPITDAEREELNRLRRENYELRMELDCTKKIQALVQQRQNRQMKKK